MLNERAYLGGSGRLRLAQLSSKLTSAFADKDWFIRGKYSSFALQAVADIHLYSDLDEENNNHGTND